MRRKRRICFVTGTRAEFGLMESALRAIRSHPALQLQLIVTGMHLDRSRGRSINRIRAAGWKIDRTIPWPEARTPADAAARTGEAMAGLARAMARLRPDIALVAGDRVEAFAAASAAHISGAVVAHVHGGDRAAGQVDDSLRHAITKLAHIHLPATTQSAARIRRLGEQAWRIRRVGSPGIDDAALIPRRRARGAPFLLYLLHPADVDEAVEYLRAKLVLRAAMQMEVPIVAIYPNNDPGAAGIVRALQEHRSDRLVRVRRDVPRDEFLELLRDAVALVGNSSAGIIEAATFGTRVVDVGPRQQGRERSENVTSVPCRAGAITRALGKIWNGGRPRRWAGVNVYGGGGAGHKIAQVLSNFPLDARTSRKLIAY